jgi:hypothetical protein
MRVLILALAMASVAGLAHAQLGTSIPGGEVRTSLTPTVPATARKQAQDAIRQVFHNPGSVNFRAVSAIEVATVRHGALGGPIDGPISIVCGQYSSFERKGGESDYSWFFVAIKRGKVLWTASDETSVTADEAYDSCVSAGLAH